MIGGYRVGTTTVSPDQWSRNLSTSLDTSDSQKRRVGRLVLFLKAINKACTHVEWMFVRAAVNYIKTPHRRHNRGAPGRWPSTRQRPTSRQTAYWMRRLCGREEDEPRPNQDQASLQPGTSWPNCSNMVISRIGLLRIGACVKTCVFKRLWIRYILTNCQNVFPSNW